MTTQCFRAAESRDDLALTDGDDGELDAGALALKGRCATSA